MSSAVATSELPCQRVRDKIIGRQVQMTPPDQGMGGLAALQALTGQMQRCQTGGACCVDGQTWPSEIKEMREPVREK